MRRRMCACDQWSDCPAADDERRWGPPRRHQHERVRACDGWTPPAPRRCTRYSRAASARCRCGTTCTRAGRSARRRRRRSSRRAERSSDGASHKEWLPPQRVVTADGGGSSRRPSASPPAAPPARRASAPRPTTSTSPPRPRSPRQSRSGREIMHVETGRSHLRRRSLAPVDTRDESSRVGGCRVVARRHREASRADIESPRADLESSRTTRRARA